MGKGSNASKNARARADKLKRMAEERSGGGGAAGKAARLGAGSSKRTCMICRAQFMMTQSKDQLMVHVSSKHDGRSFDEAFPTYDADTAAAAAASGGAGGSGGGKAAASGKKKGKGRR